MYKIGVMIMGKPSKSPQKVKEIIMEVQAKTKVNDILEYMVQLKKIQNSNVNIAIQKRGRPISESSTIAQILRHTKPINNLIKLYLYQIEQVSNLDQSTDKLVFAQTKQQKNQLQIQQSYRKQKQKQRNRNIKEVQQPDGPQNSGCCCC